MTSPIQRCAPASRLLLTLAGLCLIGTASARADDPPPDRLEKKPRPAPAKPEEPKRVQPPADEKSPDKPTEPAEDPVKLREDIAKDMQSAEQKLKARDAGDDTRQLQDRILRNIDKLIDLARNPPPPPMDKQSSPMDQSSQPMGGQQSQPSGGQQPQPGAQSQPGSQSRPQGGLSRRERREQQRRQREQQARGQGRPRPQPGGQSQPTAGQQQQTGMQPGGGRGRPGGAPPDKMADVVKDIWGHLPETLRQEVDHYYRDQFMPRYRDLLQQYYSRLAERERTRGGDR
jgi:hypothetical protein